MVSNNMDDVEFIDAENYMPTPQGALTYEQLVLEQIRRCISEGSKEMVGGYMQQKVTAKGLIEVYVPDQREVYMQCINSLYDVLLSFFDDTMTKDATTFKENLKDAKKAKLDFLRMQLETPQAQNDRRIRYQLQLQINTGFLERDSVEARMLMEEKLDLYRILFQELLLLFSRKRYLMAEAITA